MPAELDQAKYVSFTSSKKDGSTVSTPVWIITIGEEHAFTTDSDAFKVKRVRNNPSVTMRVCNFRGRVSTHATTFSGVATVIEGQAASHIALLIKNKYRVGYLLITVQSAVKRLLGKESHSAETAITVRISK